MDVFLPQFAPADLVGLSIGWLFLAIFAGTLISEDATCIAAGALAATGEVSLAFAIGSCFTGIVTGDLALYWAGRVFGGRIAAWPSTNRFVADARFSRASDWLTQRGASAVFLSRFVTGLRLPTYLAAGFLRTDFTRFAFYFMLAAAIWTPLVVGSVALAGVFGGASIGMSAIGIFILVRMGMKVTNRRSRRMMIGRLRRITRWEFWPLWLFYIPVIGHILILSLKHRSLTVFTCANPAIPGGGFAGESKDAIYSLLATAPDNRDFLLHHALIKGRLSLPDKIAMAEGLIRAAGLLFPVVVKPDAGERGRGVAIVESQVQLGAALREVRSDVLIQEFFSGHEASVFYFRRPDAERGEIFSITEKIFPNVVGDGVLTIEELILKDERAVAMAPKYFKENSIRLFEVPDAGEQVQLVSIGSHSRGAVFRDGRHLWSRELAVAIDAICRPVEGFNFGRFDIRFRSVEEFRRGRGFKVIELNGVTSESTNIYDPRYSLADAYRILFRQWRIAFEIGAENRRLGVTPTRVRDLINAALAR